MKTEDMFLSFISLFQQLYTATLFPCHWPECHHKALPSCKGSWGMLSYIKQFYAQPKILLLCNKERKDLRGKYQSRQ